MNEFNFVVFMFLAFLASADHSEIQGFEHRALILSQATRRTTLISLAAYPSTNCCFFISRCIIFFLKFNISHELYHSIDKIPFFLPSIFQSATHLPLSKLLFDVSQDSKPPSITRTLLQWQILVQSKRLALFNILFLEAFSLLRGNGPGPVATQSSVV